MGEKEPTEKRRRDDNLWFGRAKMLIGGAVGIALGSVTSTVAVVSYTERIVMKTAIPIIEARVAPLERADLMVANRVSAIEAEMMRTTTAEFAYRKQVLAKLDALCRATPKAGCPLGENER